MKFKLNILCYKYLILGSTAAITQNDQCQIAYEIRKGRFIMKLKKIFQIPLVFLREFKLSLRRPLRKKLQMRWFFDVSKVKESSFSKSDLTDPPQIFDAHLLENTDLSPSRFHFSVGFISRSCFKSDGLIAYSNE